MTTSGTNLFNPDLNEMCEEAFERAGREMRSGYDLRTARRSINLMLADWGNRGINLWTIEQGTINLLQGTNTYDLPVDTVDLLDHVIRTGQNNPATQSDLTITRISSSTYATIPNKLTQGRPIQVWVQRLTGQDYPATSDYSPGAIAYPRVTVWPTPNQGTLLSPYYQFVYWRLRRMQDAGNGINTFDIPWRFLNCFVAGLAYYIAMKIPEGTPRLEMLKASYDEAWQTAAGEDREKAADRFVPRQYFIGSAS
jgi:hypothetical protein